MTYGRILLIGTLAFGAIYYYQSEQAERVEKAFRHQLALQEDAAQRREAERYREKQEREEAAFLAEQKRAAEDADRDLAQQYVECFGRPAPNIAFMSDKDKANLFILMNPDVLAKPHPSPCHRMRE